MPKNLPSLSSFLDVRQVLDVALENPPFIIYTLDTQGQAINFRFRCYQFRKVLAASNAAQAEAAGLDHISEETIYSPLKFTLTDSDGNPTKTGNSVKIEKINLRGTIKSASGQTLEPNTESAPNISPEVEEFPFDLDPDFTIPASLDLDIESE